MRLPSRTFLKRLWTKVVFPSPNSLYFVVLPFLQKCNNNEFYLTCIITHQRKETADAEQDQTKTDWDQANNRKATTAES